MRELDTGLSHGGATGLRRLAPELRPLFRDVALVSAAAQGQQPHDLSRLIQASASVSRTLARNPDQLTGITIGLDRTARALLAGDGALGQTVEGLGH